MDGSLPSYAEVLAAPVGGMKLSCVEALASDLRRWLSMGGGACLTEVSRSLAGVSNEDEGRGGSGYIFWVGHED